MYVKHEEWAVMALPPAGVGASINSAILRSLRQLHVPWSSSCGRLAFPEGTGSSRAVLPAGRRAVGLLTPTAQGPRHPDGQVLRVILGPEDGGGVLLRAGV